MRTGMNGEEEPTLEYCQLIVRRYGIQKRGPPPGLCEHVTEFCCVSRDEIKIFGSILLGCCGRIPSEVTTFVVESPIEGMQESWRSPASV